MDGSDITDDDAVYAYDVAPDVDLRRAIVVGLAATVGVLAMIMAGAWVGTMAARWVGRRWGYDDGG